MLHRQAEATLRKRLTQFPIVGLLGPRQVGKTTLAQRLGKEMPSVYLDLENPTDRAKLSDPGAYLKLHDDKLVILDEIQRVPGLFEILRGILDERIRNGRLTGQMLVLGSASLDLLRQSSESLAGRIAYIEMAPLNGLEIATEQLAMLWSRGGFPRSFLAVDDEISSLWREAFISTYLERDIPQLGPRIPSTTLRRFWIMLAHQQGGLLNQSKLASSLGVDGRTIGRYLDLLVDLLLVRRLPAFSPNAKKRLVKAPKIYVRDSGVVHALLGIGTLESLLGHPIAGTSFEGMVIETLLQAAPPRTDACFYRTAAGAEMDLVLSFPSGKRWAIEIKRSPGASLGVGFHHARADLAPDKTFLVHASSERFPLPGNIWTTDLRSLALQLTEM